MSLRDSIARRYGIACTAAAAWQEEEKKLSCSQPFVTENANFPAASYWSKETQIQGECMNP
jgi:hypothetical protein